MSTERVIKPYDGPQFGGMAGTEAAIRHMMGTIEVVDDRLMQLGCVICDGGSITELHWFPAPKASLS